VSIAKRGVCGLCGGRTGCGMGGAVLGAERVDAFKRMALIGHVALNSGSCRRPKGTA